MPLANVIIKICPVLLFTLYNTKNTAYHFTTELIFYADKIMVMGNSKNLRVFNFAILLKSRKLQKFDALKIYIFYSIHTKDLTSSGPVDSVKGSSHVVVLFTLLLNCNFSVSTKRTRNRS